MGDSPWRRALWCRWPTGERLVEIRTKKGLDAEGLAACLERIEAAYTRTGDHAWKPSALLKQLVAEGQTFEQWSKARAA